jgi:hypothetical protein
MTGSPEVTDEDRHVAGGTMSVGVLCGIENGGFWRLALATYSFKITIYIRVTQF